MWKKFNISVTKNWLDGQLVLCQVWGTPVLLEYDEGKFFDDEHKGVFCTPDEIEYYIEIPVKYEE